MKNYSLLISPATIVVILCVMTVEPWIMYTLIACVTLQLAFYFASCWCFYRARKINKCVGEDG